jgi:hypothetical protein
MRILLSRLLRLPPRGELVLVRFPARPDCEVGYKSAQTMRFMESITYTIGCCTAFFF